MELGNDNRRNYLRSPKVTARVGIDGTVRDSNKIAAEGRVREMEETEVVR